MQSQLIRCLARPTLLATRLPGCSLAKPGYSPQIQIMATRTDKRHHGHHGHQHDNRYLVSRDQGDPGVRITRVGLYINLLMAGGKAAGGYLLHSQALMADAFHSLTDLVSDVLTLSTVSYSQRKASSRFPLGYGKIESLGGLGVSGLLLAGGLGLGWHSVEILSNLWLSDVHDEHMDHGLGSLFGHSHSHNPADMGIPNIHAAWIAGGSIIVKEYLYRKSTCAITCESGADRQPCGSQRTRSRPSWRPTRYTIASTR